MALVIEDGTVVAGANSYIDITDATAYAAARGVDLGSDDILIEQRLLFAMDYLESLRYKGSRTDPSHQLLSWPRSDVTFDGYTVGSHTIPTQLKSAQAQLAVELTNGVVIWASSSSGGSDAKFVKREKLDVIETEYATPKETGELFLEVASMPAVNALLRNLLKGLSPLYAYRG